MMKSLYQKLTWILTVLFTVSAFIFFLAFDKKDAVSDETYKEERTVPGLSAKSDLSAEDDELPVLRSWENFGKKDGLPSNKITSVRVDQDRVWVGTDKGLAVYRDEKWSVITTKDGLSHNYILGVEVSELTGEVWIATMSGLNRWSAGDIEIFNQFNSGLANDVVYAVVSDSQYVWTATAAGASRFNIYTDQWEIFNEQNAPMHEPWTYGIADGEDRIYIAAWGGGIIEYFKDSGRFRVHRDPDHQMEIDLYPDDGLVHDVITGVTYQDNTLWAATYFGLSRYDGAHWKSYFEQNSGLASNFINYIESSEGVVYICTDKGLSTFDGQTWITYSKKGSKGEIIVHEGGKERKLSSSSSIADNYIWGVDMNDTEIWVATSNGISRAKLTGDGELSAMKQRK